MLLGVIVLRNVSLRDWQCAPRDRRQWPQPKRLLKTTLSRARRVNTDHMATMSRRMKEVGALATAFVVVAGCGATDGEADRTPDVVTATTTSDSPTTSATTAATSSTSLTSSSPPPSTTHAPAAPATPTAAVVTEGAACGPRGAVAVFVDGTTAYCARLQYTDGAAWSRDPQLAPNPAVEEAMRQAGPQLGDQCIGADIGRRSVDVNGIAILCDNYMWRQDVGQEPRHPWVEDQIRWTECLEQATEDECRELLSN